MAYVITLIRWSPAPAARASIAEPGVTLLGLLGLLGLEPGVTFIRVIRVIRVRAWGEEDRRAEEGECSLG